MNNKKNKVAVVTGAARGIGRAIAVSLAKKQYELALIDLNKEALEHTYELCASEGVRCEIYSSNVAKEDEIVWCFEQIIKRQHRMDIVINNAAILWDGLLVKEKAGEIRTMSLEQWRRVIDVNLTGVFLCGREAAVQMIKHKTGGVIINMSSIARHGNFGQTNYAAAKAGVAAMTVTWAQELAKHRIRCMAIAPGVIATDMIANMKSEQLEQIKNSIPMKSLGETDHIEKTVHFILENDYLTGRVIEVDGGLRF